MNDEPIKDGAKGPSNEQRDGAGAQDESAAAEQENADTSSLDRDRIRDLALFLPRLLKLIGRLLADPEVPGLDKMVLGAAVLYVVGPIDLIPDSIPVIGQLDDLYLLSLCLLRLLNRSGEEKLRQYWEGPEDIVQLLAQVTRLSTRVLPEKVRGIIHSWVDAKSSSGSA